MSGGSGSSWRQVPGRPSRLPRADDSESLDCIAPFGLLRAPARRASIDRASVEFVPHGIEFYPLRFHVGLGCAARGLGHIWI